jgi:hypothetical protein
LRLLLLRLLLLRLLLLQGLLLLRLLLRLGLLPAGAADLLETGHGVLATLGSLRFASTFGSRRNVAEVLMRVRRSPREGARTTLERRAMATLGDATCRRATYH